VESVSTTEVFLIVSELSEKQKVEEKKDQCAKWPISRLLLFDTPNSGAPHLSGIGRTGYKLFYPPF
jgi:hypothetical protein